MDYEVLKFLDDGAVEFRLHARSRASGEGAWWARIGFLLFGRREQMRFYFRCCARIARLTPRRWDCPTGPRRRPCGCGRSRSPADEPLRLGHRVVGQPLDAADARQLRPRPGDRHAVPRCERRALLQRLGPDRAEDDHGRTRAPSRVVDALYRRVGAQVVDPPAPLPERQAERDQAQVVSLAFGTCEKRAWAGTPAPAARQPKQAPSQDVRREVLLRDGQLAPLPALTERRAGTASRPRTAARRRVIVDSSASKTACARGSSNASSASPSSARACAGVEDRHAGPRRSRPPPVRRGRPLPGPQGPESCAAASRARVRGPRTSTAAARPPTARAAAGRSGAPTRAGAPGSRRSGDSARRSAGGLHRPRR